MSIYNRYFIFYYRYNMYVIGLFFRVNSPPPPLSFLRVQITRDRFASWGGLIDFISLYHDSLYHNDRLLTQLTTNGHYYLWNSVQTKSQNLRQKQFCQRFKWHQTKQNEIDIVYTYFFDRISYIDDVWSSAVGQQRSKLIQPEFIANIANFESIDNLEQYRHIFSIGCKLFKISYCSNMFSMEYRC